MKKQPAVLLITADELNREALGCYGATSHATPSIDRLASQGMIFDRAYSSSPICLPARCSMATGLFPHRSRSVSNGTGMSLSLDLPNIFRLFHGAGYHTSVHGKCHFIPVPYASNNRGFTREYEHFILYYRALGMDRLDLMDDPQVSAWYYDDYAKDLERRGLLAEYRRLIWDCRKPSFEVPFPGVFRFPGPDGMQPDSWVGQKALECIDEHRPGVPGFLWVSFGGPHYPLCAPQEYYRRVDMSHDRPRRLRDGEWQDTGKLHAKAGAGGYVDGDGYAPEGFQKGFTDEYWRSWRHAYYASVVQIDEYVGQLVAAAEKKWGDLVVVFTADHGDMMGDHGIWGKEKCAYDQVLRVPLILRGPATEGGGSRRAEIVQTLDILPTLARACGISVADMDGRDLRDLVAAGGRGHFLAESDNFAAVGDSRWKYSCAERQGTRFEELYDLAADPDELENIVQDRGAQSDLRRLRAILDDYQMRESLHDTLFYKDRGPPPWAKLS